MRFGVLGLLLGACGRLGFEVQALERDGAIDGIVDQEIDDCGVRDADTIALYTFDGALGDDASGNHPGSIRDNVTVGAPRCGTASAVFDTGYLLVPDAPAFDLATGSVEMFARLSSVTTLDNQTLLARDSSGTLSAGHFLILVTTEGELVARLQVPGSTDLRCAAAVPAAQWIHVGVSFGGLASEGFRMWLDGVEATAPSATLEGGTIGCGSPTTVGIDGNDNALLIGASNARHLTDGDPDPTVSQHVLGGEIDHVHIRKVWRDFGR